MKYMYGGYKRIFIYFVFYIFFLVATFKGIIVFKEECSDVVKFKKYVLMCT